MELLKEVLVRYLERTGILCAGLEIEISRIVKNECYMALQKIKTIVENDSLSDFECIEEIVCVFEELGSRCGARHDFG